MKIYNKKGFATGMFLTVIGLAMLATSIWTGFEVKGTILMAACLVFGVPFVTRSFSPAMSREDKLAELDERNRLVKLRSRSAALTWTQWLCLALLILSRLPVGLFGEEICAALTIAFGLMYLILFVTELAALAWFEKKL